MVRNLDNEGWLLSLSWLKNSIGLEDKYNFIETLVESLEQPKSHGIFQKCQRVKLCQSMVMNIIPHQASDFSRRWGGALLHQRFSM